LAYHFDWSILLQYRGLLLEGLVATIELVAASIIASFVLGVGIGLLRVFAWGPVRLLCAVYTELFRDVPPLVQFFFWNFAVGLDVFPSALVGLAVFTSPYIAEIVRSGVLATPRAQVEAARCSGMTALQMTLHVVMPQAVMRSLPALSIEFINIVKNSAVAMTISYTELTFQTQQIEADTFRGFEAATAVTILYVMLSAVVVVAMHAIEAAMRVAVRRG
jgi:polar amino acid transport system permease protein